MRTFEVTLENTQGATKQVLIRAHSHGHAEQEMKFLLLPNVRIIKIKEVVDASK